MGAHDRPDGAGADNGPQPRDETVDDRGPRMEVRLTRKLADSIDGVDLRGRVVGDIFKLPAPLARLLIAEGWAVQDTNARPGTN